MRCTAQQLQLPVHTNCHRQWWLTFLQLHCIQVHTLLGMPGHNAPSSRSTEPTHLSPAPHTHPPLLQVLSQALSIWNLQAIPYDNSELRAEPGFDPLKETAYICNLQARS